MLLGPRDRRLERSRCLRCAKSHLKCTGDTPCLNCNKRGHDCVYPGKKSLTVGWTIANQHTIRNGSLVCSIPRKPNSSRNGKMLNLFLTRFVRENDFTGCSSSWFIDVQAQFASNAAVHHAILALSALYACRGDSTNTSGNRQLALESYQSAVTEVRTSIDAKDPQIDQPLLSSTFLLGLFELMYDPTGQGWIQHTMHGTSKILQHLGPNAFRSGPGLTFFHQMKMFEVSRALIFSESSFLVDAAWMHLISATSTSEPNHHPIEQLLPLMVSCSDHCSTVLRYLKPLNPTTLSPEQITRLHALARQGFHLRLQLYGINTTLSTSSTPHSPRTLIAKIYLAATLIFLSGIYDYRSVFWRTHFLPTPSLPRDLIRENVSLILLLTELAVESTNLSLLLFLYPLRVASARVWTGEQRARIRSLFGVIEKAFAVARVFVHEVEEMWEARLYCPIDFDTS